MTKRPVVRRTAGFFLDPNLVFRHQWCEAEQETAMCRSIVVAIFLVTNAALGELRTNWDAEWHYWVTSHTTLTAVQLSRIRQ